MTRKTIQVSETTYKELVEAKADFMNTHSIHTSFDVIISDALEFSKDDYQSISQ